MGISHSAGSFTILYWSFRILYWSFRVRRCVWLVGLIFPSLLLHRLLCLHRGNNRCLFEQRKSGVSKDWRPLSSFSKTVSKIKMMMLSFRLQILRTTTRRKHQRQLAKAGRFLRAVSSQSVVLLEFIMRFISEIIRSVLAYTRVENILLLNQKHIGLRMLSSVERKFSIAMIDLFLLFEIHVR